MVSPGLESALIGIPAHITVLAPFMPPRMINAPVLTQLGQLFADVSPFQFRLDRTDWFSDHVLWLAPGDPGPFRDLTQRVFQKFPAFPPFEGKHDVVVPHLTVGWGHPLSGLRAAEEAIQDSLPIDARAAAVALMAEQSAGGRWTKTAAFTLG
jgi:2'-5' RNA ligase